MHKRLLTALMGSAVLLHGPLSLADTPPGCDVHLVVHVTPDVPNPGNAGFLSSLVTDPNFRLVWLGKISDRDWALELRGPGAPEACDRVIEGMRRDARVVSVEIQGSGV